jgi:hypothetical protein
MARLPLQRSRSLCPSLPVRNRAFGRAEQDGFWSGGWLRCDCTVGDLAHFLRAVRARCPGVWLCDGGDHTERGGSRLHTPETLLALPAIQSLTFGKGDAGWAG